MWHTDQLKGAVFQAIFYRYLKDRHMNRHTILTFLAFLICYQLISMECPYINSETEQNVNVEDQFNKAIGYLQQNNLISFNLCIAESENLIYFKDFQGMTLLMFATLYQNIMFAKSLIAAQCNVNIQDNKKNTALHYAAQNNHIALVKELLNAGAQIDIENEDGNTPFDLAAQQIMPGQQENALPSFRNIDYALLRTLVLHGAHVNQNKHANRFNNSLLGHIIKNNVEQAEKAVTEREILSRYNRFNRSNSSNVRSYSRQRRDG